MKSKGIISKKKYFSISLFLPAIIFLCPLVSYAAAPVITGIAPNPATASDTIMVSGRGFTPTGNNVYFLNGMVSSLNSSDGKSLSFAIPDWVSLTSSSTDSTSSITTTTLTNQLPSLSSTIISFSTSSAPTDTDVAITGMGFAPPKYSFYVNFTSSILNSYFIEAELAKDGTLHFNVPDLDSGSYNVNVIAVRKGKANVVSNTLPFQIIDPPVTTSISATSTPSLSATSTIASFSTSTASAGSDIYISGTNFSAPHYGYYVNFSNQLYSDYYVGGNLEKNGTLHFQVPDIDPGTYSVNVLSSRGKHVITSNTLQFQIIDPPVSTSTSATSTITSLSQNSAPSDTKISIYGTGLTAPHYSYYVNFQGQNTNLYYVGADSEKDGSLTFNVPDLDIGDYSLNVISFRKGKNTISSNAVAFSVIAAPVSTSTVATSTITSLSADSAPEGTEIEIDGTGFEATHYAYYINFTNPSIGQYFVPGTLAKNKSLHFTVPDIALGAYSINVVAAKSNHIISSNSVPFNVIDFVAATSTTSGNSTSSNTIISSSSVITSFSTSSASIDSEIAITGTNFTAPGYHYYVNFTNQNLSQYYTAGTLAKNGTLHFEVPELDVGTYNVNVIAHKDNKAIISNSLPFTIIEDNAGGDQSTALNITPYALRIENANGKSNIVTLNIISGE